MFWQATSDTLVTIGCDDQGMTRMPFHLRLKHERRLRRWTQRELAGRSLLNRWLISHLEHRRRLPNREHVVRLAKAFGLRPDELLGSTSLRATPRPRPSWHRSKLWRRFAPRRGRYVLDRERDNWVRLRAARKGYRAQYDQWLPRALEHQGRDGFSEFLHFACCGSGLEMVSWLKLMTVGILSYFSLMRLGWRRLPIIEEPSNDLVGDLLWPALVLEGPLLCALFPQVRVLTPDGPFRMDLLACVRVGKSLIWVNIEVDGPYHRADRDERRRKFIGLPRVKLTEEDVCASDFIDRLFEKLAIAVAA